MIFNFHIFNKVKGTAPQQEELCQQEEPCPKIEDIINYEIKDDIVYGYLNQEALDKWLYYRAKVRTHDFKDKDKFENQKDKFAVTLEDFHKNEHCIHNFPIADGEYVSKGDLIFVLGLNDISFSNYCYDYYISEYSAQSHGGVKIYSEYEGIFTNKIIDKRIVICMPGNVIQHGDLLFTIKIGPKPEEEKTSVHEVLLDYNMLSKDFLNEIPYLEDITVGAWYVDNNSFVKKGDPILEVVEFTNVSEPRYKTTITSPYSGRLTKGKLPSGKLRKNDHLFTINEEDPQQEESNQ